MSVCTCVCPYACTCVHPCAHVSTPISQPPQCPRTGAPLCYQGVALLATQGSLSRDRPWPPQHLISTCRGRPSSPSGGQMPPGPEDWGLGGRGFLGTQTEARSGFQPPSAWSPPKPPAMDVGTWCQPASPSTPDC
ncbi:Hypothetical predicted protein [Marmota monax]|uniref:Uncharacterized protein n=1 Tax=Marmota monax TaxID=9995 RepID=A0A5E4C8R7_MARMO|nr:hypothetical protein GHT09_011051 [Marmota monax]VTJ77529.1 Hypothetical predicted protein [Marmota monax]